MRREITSRETPGRKRTHWQFRHLSRSNLYPLGTPDLFCLSCPLLFRLFSLETSCQTSGYRDAVRRGRKERASLLIYSLPFPFPPPFFPLCFLFSSLFYSRFLLFLLCAFCIVLACCTCIVTIQLTFNLTQLLPHREREEKHSL